MQRTPPIVWVVAALFGVGAFAVLGVVVYIIGSAWFGIPVGAKAPEQPIAFPHTVHAGLVEEGGLGLSCTFCHRNVDKGAAAIIPSVQQCMFCHSQIKGSTEEAMAQISILREAAVNGEPVNWVRVHRLPDHVQFVHDAHVRFFTAAQGVEPSQTCSICHGDVAKMAQVNQVRSLKMGDCVDCHREYSAPTDCAICHY